MNGCGPRAAAVLTWIASFVLLVPYQIGLPKATTMIALLILVEIPTSLLRTPGVMTALENSWYISVAVVLLLSGTVIALAERRKRAALIVLPITLLAVIVSFIAGYLAIPPQYRWPTNR